MKIRLNPHRHCGGFIFADTSSKSTTSNVDARTAASEGSIAVGQEGKFVEGADVSGSRNARVGTTEVTGDVTVTTADPEVLTTALEQIGELSRGNTSAFSAFARESHAQQAEDLATLLGALGQLDTETDADARKDRTILYVVLGLLALMAVVFWPKGLFRRLV